MNSYHFLFEISLILFSTKLLGLISRRIKLPQVVGALLAGIIIGPGVLNLVVESEFIMQLSEIGVIFLMFIAGLETVPVIVKKYNTEEMTEVALVENLQREGLDPIEEALAYQGLMDTYKQTQEMISARLGRSRSYIANMVRLLYKKI